MADQDDPAVSNHHLILIDGLVNLYQEEILCDLTLQAENQQVKVHKCVLAASSPYFRAMFTLDTSELSQATVKLQSVSGFVLTDIIKYIYTGKIELDDNNIQAVITAANMFQIEALVIQCIDYMTSALCMENCLEVYSFADFHSLDPLKQNAETFIVQHFTHLCMTDSLNLLSLSCLTNLIKSDDLDVAREEIVYDAVMKWVNHDVETRKADLLLLILCVRFPLMSCNFIRAAVIIDPLIRENSLCSHLITQTLEMISNESIEGVSSFSSNLRLGMYKKNVIVFSGGAESFSDRSFTCYDKGAKRCLYSIKSHPTFDFKYKLDFYKLIVTDKNDIFFIGGIFYDDYHFQIESGHASAKVFVYDENNKCWQGCSQMPNGRCAFGACSYKDSIYVFGGYQRYPRSVPTDTVISYNIELDTWLNLRSMPEKIAHQAACVFHDSAFLFGGKGDDFECLSIVLQYSFKSDQWTFINSEIPRPIAESTAIVHKDKIYILGGVMTGGHNISVFLFSPNESKSQWHCCEDFPDERKFTSITKGDENTIFVCGGTRLFISGLGVQRRTRTVENKDLYRYDIKTDAWHKEASNIKCASNYMCCMASVNVKLLKEVDFL